MDLILQERRRAPRNEIFIQTNLESPQLGDSIPVWIKNFSIYGMKLVFFKIFYCNKCPRLKDILYMKCNGRRDCKIYNLNKLVKFLNEGEIINNIMGENVKQKYRIKWYKTFNDINTIEFGIEFFE